MILGFIRVSLININISVVFCWSLIGGYYVRYDFRRGALAASSLVGSLVSFSVSSLVNSLVSSSVSSLVSFSSSGYKYNFTVVVLKSVGL